MRSARRLIAALALAALCAPGTFLRTEVSGEMPRDIALEQIAGPSATGSADWKVAGIWQYEASSRNFGGYSALLTLSSNRLRAFSDRGTRFTFIEPDQPRETAEERVVSAQVVQRDYARELWDIESATRDPATGAYWLGYEHVHAIHRFTVGSVTDGLRDLSDEVDWYENAGAEAMLRLADGRFIVIPEGNDEALLFASDPVEQVKPETFTFINPARSYAVTDLAQLPDGRVLLLMRNVEWGFPPFAGLIAIAEPPVADAEWRPEITLRFDNAIPRENYEGLAVRALEDGRIAVWVIADDNFSVIQRNLLVKLLFDPSVRP